MQRVGLAHDTSASPPPAPTGSSSRQDEPFQNSATLKPAMRGAGWLDLRAESSRDISPVPNGYSARQVVVMTDLAARAELSLATASELVSALQDLGCLERRADGTDKRATLSCPTTRMSRPRRGGRWISSAGSRVAGGCTPSCRFRRRSTRHPGRCARTTWPRGCGAVPTSAATSLVSASSRRPGSRTWHWYRSAPAPRSGSSRGQRPNCCPHFVRHDPAVRIPRTPYPQSTAGGRVIAAAFVNRTTVCHGAAAAGVGGPVRRRQAPIRLRASWRGYP